jgi:hypothetical protein
MTGVADLQFLDLGSAVSLKSFPARRLTMTPRPSPNASDAVNKNKDALMTFYYTVDALR